MPSGLKYLSWLFAMVLLLSSCENDIERIHMLTSEEHMPASRGQNVEIIYTDSARLKTRMEAPSYLQYPDVEEPYMEFPEGLVVFFYNDTAGLESEIRADHCRYLMEKNLWHATGNVVAQNFENGDALYTEELFWDEGKEEIYSHTYTRVHNGESVMYGNKGFKSHQSLENWQLIGSSGTLSVEDNE